MGGVEDGTFGDDEVVGGRKLGEKFGQESGGDSLDMIAVDSEAGDFFGEENGESGDRVDY